MNSMSVDTSWWHDAILVEFHIHWKEGTCVFRLHLIRSKEEPGRAHVVTAHDFIDVRCPRKRPWGPSIYVLEASITVEDDQEELLIQMQSGDEISITAASFTQEEIIRT